MARYINADDLAIKFRMLAEDPWNKDTGTTWSNAYEECADDVDEFPTADVVERKKGKWIRHPEQKNIFGGKTIECSECSTKYVVQYIEDEKYCRNCGSRNGEKGEDND